MPGGLIDVELVGSPSAVWRNVALKWVEISARIRRHLLREVSCPARKTSHRIMRGRPGRAAEGRLAGGVRSSRSRSGATPQRQLSATTGRLTHEMVHLALPSLPDPHHWLEEGLATYVEPIARARALILTPEQAWADLVNGLPQGQPEAGDPRSGSHAHLGPNLLGWRALLPASRRGIAPAHGQSLGARTRLTLNSRRGGSISRLRYWPGD